MAGPRLRDLFVLATLATIGCVERRFVVETNVPGALVSVNNLPVGPSPADSRWEYPGKYEFRAVAQGYEPLVEVKQISPKWYEYPGLDFFFEALWPFHIEDVRRVHLTLVPAAQVRTDELLDVANRLREQARSLPPPQDPEPPQPRPAAPARPAPPPVIAVPDEPGSPPNLGSLTGAARPSGQVRPQLPPRSQ